MVQGYCEMNAIAREYKKWTQRLSTALLILTHRPNKFKVKRMCFVMHAKMMIRDDRGKNIRASVDFLFAKKARLRLMWK